MATIQHFHDGKRYTIEFPGDVRVVRSKKIGEGMIWLGLPNGREEPIFEEPGELLVSLAREGRWGLRIVSVDGEEVSPIRA